MSRLFFHFLCSVGYLLFLLGPVYPGTLDEPLFVEHPSNFKVPVAEAVPPWLLQSQPGATDQAVFVQKLRRAGKNKRELFTHYLPKIGVNGILEGIHALWPICHSEAHDLGKVIFAQVRKLHQSVSLCSGSCHGGCLHGVLMEALGYLKDSSGKGLDLPALKIVATKLCDENPNVLSAHSPGNCYHGVGHGLMLVLNYEISKALLGCKTLGEVHREYYCVTGAFMEYVTEKDSQDAISKGLLYPCVENAFPAACARYKMVHVAKRHYKKGKTTQALQQKCQGFKGGVRIGCFHGLGNAHVSSLVTGRIRISELCLGLQEDETQVCIDGAIERIAQYHQPKAVQICQELDAQYKALCLSGVKRKMYDMSKDLSPYVIE